MTPQGPSLTDGGWSASLCKDREVRQTDRQTGSDRRLGIYFGPSKVLCVILRASLLSRMRRGFLLGDLPTGRSARQRFPTGRSATEQPPTERLATERPSTDPPATERRPERGFTASGQEVLCVLASRLALFTGEASVLGLCRGQERELWMRIGHFIPFMSNIRAMIATLPLPSPMSIVFATLREPNRFLLAHLFFYDLGRQLRCLFFQIWRVWAGGRWNP